MTQIMENDKIIVVEKQPKYIEYDNNTVIIMIPERPIWLKTSITGKWVYELLLLKELNVKEIIALAVKKYSLPESAIHNSIVNFILQLEENGFVKFSSDKAPINKKYLKRSGNNLKNEDLSDLGLISVWFNILSTCNLSCQHCFINKDKLSKPISIKKAKFIIDNLIRLKPKRICISGGEPLLHPDLVEILKYAKESSNWEIFLITNGITSDIELLKSISQYLTHIQISIDGINAETNDKIRGNGAFDKTVNTFKILNSLDINVHKIISFTPHPLNVTQIPELFKLAIPLNADSIAITKPHVPSENNNSNSFNRTEFLSMEFREKVYSYYDQLLKIFVKLIETTTRSSNIKIPTIDTYFDSALNLLSPFKKTCCGAGSSILFVNEKGDCFPCSALIRPELNLGNLFKSDIEEIYYTNAVTKFRKSIHVDNIEDCKECVFKYICAGDCRALSSDIKDKTPYCDLIKKRYHTLLRNVHLPK